VSLLSTDIGRAVEVLRSGGLVAVPTETVYGLAADASNPAAVERIFAIKGRPAGHPLIVHLADADDLDIWADHPAPIARILAGLAWPGPLTLIVPRSPLVPDAVTGGRDTVGLRVPSHPVVHELLRRSGLGIAAPSANRFGSVSPTTAEHVLADLGDRLDPVRDLILDGGPSAIGIESTIVDTTVEPPQLLRAGPLTEERIGALARASGPSRASGMLGSHYAPRCEVRLVDHPDDAMALRAGTPGARVLDLSDNLVADARRLYAELRSADDDGVQMLIAVLPPPVGLGIAIRDRLEKAAAPRPRHHGQS
jgi:L-threonylcarbamoyladenylate synthase